jgi:hypothetical protein
METKKTLSDYFYSMQSGLEAVDKNKRANTLISQVY